MKRLGYLIQNLKAIALVLLPAIAAAIALGVFFLIISIPSKSTLPDMVGALKNTKSYYIIIRQDNQDAVPEMDMSAITYEGYVENAEGKAMLKSKGSSEFNEIIVGNDIYDNTDGKWSKHDGGTATINNLNTAVLPQMSGETLKSSGIVSDSAATHIYTYSNTPKDMFGPFNRSVYWLTNNNIPIRVVHSVDHEMGSTTTTIEISKVNQSVNITPPVVK